jgi:tRNA-specific 2-thiouridylase
VLRTDAATNTVVAGSHEELATTRVEARGRLYAPVSRAKVKLRYASTPISASIDETEGGFAVGLDVPAFGVATGQVAVVYDDDVVTGAGVITAVA